MQTVKLLLLILISVIMLGACGLKGPLYLPTENPIPEPATEQATDPAADETQQKGDSEKEDANKKESGTGKQ